MDRAGAQAGVHGAGRDGGVKRIVAIGVDAGGRRFAAEVATFLGQALADASVVPLDFGLEHTSLEADGAILCMTRTGLSTDDVFLLTGALHGALGDRAPLVPLLLDLTPDEISRTPLGLFQAATLDRGDMRALAAELGALSGDDAVDQAWEAFYDATRNIPGPLPSDILVSVGVQSRVVSFRFRTNEDRTWADTIGSILSMLPKSPLEAPPFDPDALEALDVETSNWIDLPALLSRTPSHIGLVDESLQAHFHADPRLLSRELRDALPTNGIMDTFLVIGGKIALLRRTR
jgi:hypothetical protein